MQNNTLSQHTVSFGLALAVSSVLNALLVVAKEKSPALQAEMKSLTGSHWITHVAVILVVFLAIGFLAPGGRAGQGATLPVNRLIKIIVAGMVAAGAIIVGFYLIAG